MKKVVGILLAIFIIIIAGSYITRLKVLRIKETFGAFPHFKQALFKYNGSIYAWNDCPTDIPFVFIDEEKMSELASADNIKELTIFDTNNNKVHINKFNTFDGYGTKNYITRTLQVNASFEKTGTYNLSKISLLFKDGNRKDYEIGDLKIVVKPKEDPNLFVNGSFLTQYIPTSNSNYYSSFSVTGLYMNINLFQGDEIKIKNIDVGLKNAVPDYSNIALIDGEFDINKLGKSDTTIDKKLNAFDDISFCDKEAASQAVDINVSGGKNNLYTLLIPIRYEKDSINEGKLVVYNPKLDIIYKGKQMEIYSSQPLVYLPTAYLSEDAIINFLGENGK